jgi:hypothetical protein
MTLVQRFLTGALMVTRKGPGFYKNGFYQAGIDQTLIINGSLQPLSAREIKFVEEGDRLKQLFKLYSDAPILTDDMRKLSGADRVRINDNSYKVISVEYWQGTALPYYKSILAREPNQPPGGNG